MLDHWTTLINNGKQEIDFVTEIVRTAGEIIARTSFGISGEEGKTVFKKLGEGFRLDSRRDVHWQIEVSLRLIRSQGIKVNIENRGCKKRVVAAIKN